MTMAPGFGMEPTRTARSTPPTVPPQLRRRAAAGPGRASASPMPSPSSAAAGLRLIAYIVDCAARQLHHRRHLDRARLLRAIFLGETLQSLMPHRAASSARSSASATSRSGGRAMARRLAMMPLGLRVVDEKSGRPSASAGRSCV